VWEQYLKEPSGPSLEQLIRVMGVTEDALRTGRAFQIPAYRWTGFKDSSAMRGAGDLMAAEKGSKKLVILPAAESGEAWGIVVDNAGKRDPLTREAALAWVERAFDNNQPVWIVVKSEKKRKINLPKRKQKA